MNLLLSPFYICVACSVFTLKMPSQFSPAQPDMLFWPIKTEANSPGSLKPADAASLLTAVCVCMHASVC